MTTKPPDRKLNDDQLQILKLLLKFRFITRQLLTDYFTTTNPGMDIYRKLQVLESRGLIGKRFENSYRLRGKPAAYFLQPDGARKLQEHWPENKPAIQIKLLYKDKTVSEQFIEHCLDIAKISLSLRTQNESLRFFTKADLNHKIYDYFPQPLPDAYVRLESGQQYLLQMHYDHQPFFVAVRALMRYAKYYEGYIWDDTGTDFPIILLVVESKGAQKRIHKIINKHISDIAIYTALKSDFTKNKTGDIWHDPSDPDEFYTIEQLSELKP